MQGVRICRYIDVKPCIGKQFNFITLDRLDPSPEKEMDLPLVRYFIAAVSRNGPIKLFPEL